MSDTERCTFPGCRKPEEPAGTGIHHCVLGPCAAFPDHHPFQSARETAGGMRGSRTPESLKENERRVTGGGILRAPASNRADFPGCSLCSPCESCDDECGCVPGPCWWCGHSGRFGSESKLAGTIQEVEP